MTSARKEQFEGQLRDLQKDISHLSQRLAVPSIVSSHRYTARDVTAQSSDVLEDINKSFGSISVRTEKGDKMAQIMQEAHLAKKERDDAVYRLEQAKLEIEELRKSVQDHTRLKSSYEHLRQEFESVKMSLESSERIRKQQKELINLLQKSHSIAVAGDTSSVLSFNSISSISHAGNNGESKMGVDVSSASFAAENREWLKSSPKEAPRTSAPDGVARVRRKSHSTAVRTDVRAAAAPTTVESPAPTAAHNPTTTAPGRPPTGRSTRNKATSHSGINTSGATATTASSASKVRSASPSGVTGAVPSTKKKVKSKKAAAPAPPVDYAPTTTMPSYQTILGQNALLVPRHSVSIDGTASSHILNQSLGSTGYAGTDTAQFPRTQPSYGLPATTAQLAAQYPHLTAALHAAPAYSVPAVSTATTLGRPPRHPATVPSAVPTMHSHLPSTYHSLPVAPAYDPSAPYVGSSGDFSQHGGLLRPHTAPSAPSAPPTPATAAGTTRTKRASSASSGKKQRTPIVRRIPGSATKPRSQSAPPTRPGGTFGAASRNL